jgi:hypothetical protein
VSPHIRLGLALLLSAAPVPLAAQQPRTAPPQQPAPRPQPSRPDTLAQRLARQDSTLRAQQAQLDSLAERADSVADALQRLQQQLADQAQSKVGSRLRNRVELSGMVLVNAFYNGAKMNAADVPGWVSRSQDTTGLPNASLGGSMRQTRLGITVSGVRAAGADLGADLQLDFFSGFPLTGDDRFYTPPRIRTANVRMDWPHFGLLVGQEAPLVSQQNPVTFAQIGWPGFWGAGNLWEWTPQARATVEFGTALRTGFQVAALDPVQLKDESYSSPVAADAGEKSGRPAVEGRVYLDWGDEDNESVIGIGVHRAWLATTGTETLSSQAVTADFRIVLWGKVTLAGEAFSGQALAGLGDGGIDQNFGPQGQPVRTKGGWAQLNVQFASGWAFGGGYGMDDPNDADFLQSDATLPAGARLKNVVYQGHLHWKPGGGLLLGAELWHFQTTYPQGAISANHVNVFAGVAF